MRLRFDLGAATDASELSTDARIHPDGRDLASALSWLANNEPDVRKRIECDLAAIVPGARSVYLPSSIEQRDQTVLVTNDRGDFEQRRVRQPTPVLRLQVELDGKSMRFDADMLSEGTIFVLALLTVLHRSDAPKILLIDDIDKGLHPEGQAKLVEVIGRISTNNRTSRSSRPRTHPTS